MVMAGLLWYDDDAKRPLAAKIIEATERYRDRIGFAPTVCQLPPQQLKILTEASTSHRKRARTPVIELPRKLRLEPDERLHPNTFLLGMGEDNIAVPNPLLADHEAPPRRARQIKHPRPEKTPKAAAPAAPPLARAMKRAGIAKATPSVKLDDTTAPALKPKVAVAAKTAAAKKVAEPVIDARPTTPTVKRAVTAKQPQRVEAKQATLWDTAPAKTTRARAASKPALPSAEKGEKVARIARPDQREAGNVAKPTIPNKAARVATVAKATKATTPAKSTARRAAPSAAKPATKAAKPARTPSAKPTKPTRVAKAEQRAKPAAAGSTKATGKTQKGTAKAAQATRPTSNKRMRTVSSAEKQSARATITPAAPTKPKATRKPTLEKSVTVARPTQGAPKPATPRRRLAKSA